MNDHDVLSQLKSARDGGLPLPDGWRVYEPRSGRRAIRNQVLLLTPDGFVYGNPARGWTFRAAAYADVRDCRWKRVLTFRGNPNAYSDLNALIEQWLYTAKLVLLYNDGTRGEWRMPVDFNPSPFALAEQIVADFHAFAARRQTVGVAGDASSALGYKRDTAFRKRIVRIQNRLMAVYTWSIFIIIAAIMSIFGIELVGLGVSVLSFSLSSSANWGDAAGGVALALGLITLSSVFVVAWPVPVLYGKAKQVYEVILSWAIAAGFIGALSAGTVFLFYNGAAYPDRGLALRAVFFLGGSALSGAAIYLVVIPLRYLLRRLLKPSRLT